MSQHFRTCIKREYYPNPPQNIKFKTDFRNCVYKAMIARQWKETDGDDWNVLWCQKQQINWVFEKHRLQPTSKVNHFRGWNQLCRKDMLNKNLKKYKRQLDKQGNNSQSNQYDFLPSTYLMPSEYVLFHEEFKRYQNENSKHLWIMKPTSKCQGKGIFIFSKIGDISKWKNSSRDSNTENYVCQRYISNPMLFGGRKFDMRIYALCISYNPLTIYLYRSGFARFAHDRYDNTDLDNLYKHLTNVAINIHAPSYVKKIGGKWFLDNLKSYMLSKVGVEKTDRAFSDIQRCIIKSMKAVQKLVVHSHHSFELYGFDFLFDSEGKAWLLEVNGGPSMTSNTTQDSQLKIGLIDDVMTILNLEGVLKGDEENIGGFDLIYSQNKEILLPESSLYSTFLGCKVNRHENLKKHAKSSAMRLGRIFLQSQNGKGKIQPKKPDSGNKFSMKITKTRNTSQPVSAQNTSFKNIKKKVDNVNTDFIKYIQDRKQIVSQQQIPKPQKIQKPTNKLNKYRKPAYLKEEKSEKSDNDDQSDSSR